MKPKNGRFTFTATLLLGIILTLTSCSKEDLPIPQPAAASLQSNDNEAITSAKMAVVLTPNPKIPSPDTGLNLIPNGVYYINWMGQPSIWPDKKRVIEIAFPFWPILQVQTDNRRSQWWRVTYLGDSYYSIINDFDRSALEAEITYLNWGSLAPEGGWATGGTQNPARSYSGLKTQQWRIATSASTGCSRLYNRQTGMVIHWQNGYPSDIFMKWASNQPENILNESWKFIPKQ